MGLSSTQIDTNVKGRWNYIIAAILLSIGTISVRAVNNLAIYYVSYYSRVNNTIIQVGVSFFMGPIYSFASLLTVPLAGKLDNFIGLRSVYLISFVLLMGMSALLCFIEKFWLFLISVGILGAAIGLFSISMKYSCYFFPGNEGLITGVERTFSMSFIYLWYFIGEWIINPNHDNLLEDNLYDISITKRQKIYSLTFGLSTFLVMVVFYGLTIEIKFKGKEDNYKRIKAKLIQEQNKGNGESLTAQEIKNELSLEEKHIKYKKEIKQIFSSWDFWKLFILCVFIVFIPSLITCTFRVFGPLNGISLSTVVWHWTISGVIGSFINPLYGFLYDKIGFRPLFMIEGVGLGVAGGLYVLSLINKNPYLFASSLYCNNIFVGVFNSCIFPHCAKIFGMDYVMDLFGVLGLTIGLLGFAASGTQYIISEIIKPETQAFYYIAFTVGIVFEGFVVLFALFEKSKKFEFEKDDKMEGLVDSRLFKPTADD